MKFETSDSGQRAEYASGMVRDTSENKPRFDLLVPEGIPYTETMLYRWAMLMYRGSLKYSARNWEKASGVEELSRFKESAFRHFMAWLSGELDEDHASGILYNVSAFETIKWKVDNDNLVAESAAPEVGNLCRQSLNYIVERYGPKVVPGGEHTD